MPLPNLKLLRPPLGVKQKSKILLKKGKDDSEEKLDVYLKKSSICRPPDQLDLTDKELEEEVVKTLASVNPQLPDSLVEFNFRNNEYELLAEVSHLIDVISVEGHLLHKDSPEARKQLNLDDEEEEISKEEDRRSSDTLDVKTKEKKKKKSIEKSVDISEETDETVEEEQKEEEEEGEEDGSGGEEEEEDGKEEDKECVEEEEEVEQVEEEEDKGKKGKMKKLMNQFNFCERGSLTYNNPYREVTTQTIPPPRATYNDYVTQWIIYDAYCADYEKQMQEREKDKQAKVTVLKNPLIDSKKKQPKGFLEPSVSKMLQAAKVVERMCNQNTFDDIAQDFRYYEDVSDEFRDGEGTLLPLWKFSYENTKKYQVTYLQWHPHYYDLFGISFGSFDFLKKCAEGYLCLFSLKNPSYPEYINHVKSGVMCFDFHHTHSSFMAVGLYDGSVRVFNTALSIKQPQYRSDSIVNKHQGVVWEVVWGKDMSDGEMNFFSVSADGRIFNWILLQNQLQKNLVLNLYLAIDPVPAPDGNLIQLKACGTAIAFHPDRRDIFLVGTEEGKIYQCSTVYPSVYLCEYHAHFMPVHALSFNHYNSSIFLSCSADWRVKIWEDRRLEPLFVFDLGCSVGGVKWAPYSSSVFAAVTRDSKVWVYDVNVNKYHPVCCQQVTSGKKFQLTRLSFNFKLPVLIVGDDKGFLTTLKLSPNCRIKPKPPKKQQHLDPIILEVQKLDKLLSLVREPSAITKVDEDSSVSS